MVNESKIIMKMGKIRICNVQELEASQLAAPNKLNSLRVQKSNGYIAVRHRKALLVYSIFAEDSVITIEKVNC